MFKAAVNFGRDARPLQFDYLAAFEFPAQKDMGKVLVVGGPQFHDVTEIVPLLDQIEGPQERLCGRSFLDVVLQIGVELAGVFQHSGLIPFEGHWFVAVVHEVDPALASVAQFVAFARFLALGPFYRYLLEPDGGFKGVARS